MPKKNSKGRMGGVLLFLGSLVYLYVLFTWYMGSKGVLTGWLASASFLGPLIAAAFVVASISLLFMSFGSMAGKMEGDKMMSSVLWRLIMVDAFASVIATAGSGWFWAAILGFVLTYIGGAMAKM